MIFSFLSPSLHVSERAQSQLVQGGGFECFPPASWHPTFLRGGLLSSWPSLKGEPQPVTRGASSAQASETLPTARKESCGDHFLLSPLLLPDPKRGRLTRGAVSFILDLYFMDPEFTPPPRALSPPFRRTGPGRQSRAAARKD